MSPPQTGQEIALRLYIAGNAPNSIRAMANLDEIGREYLACWLLFGDHRCPR